MKDYAQFIYYVLATVAIVGGAVWRLSSKISTVETLATTLRDNHFHHMEADMLEVKGYIKMFVEHLIKRGN